MNFSPCCPSPAAFVQWLTTRGRPYVTAHAGQSASAAALLAAYGLVGKCASYSLNETPSGAGPNTSSVEK